MIAEYRQPARFGDVLSGRLWLSEPDPISPGFGFEILKATGHESGAAPQSIFRGYAVWNRVARVSRTPVALPESLLAGLPRTPGVTPRKFGLPADQTDRVNFHWTHKVMRSEVGWDGRVHPSVVYQWLEESIFSACDDAGWTGRRMREAGFFVLNTRHDTRYEALPTIGDTIRVTSRLIEVRRLRGTWLQEVYETGSGTLMVRDYSTGVFLDRGGRPATPPMEIMDDLRYGHP